MLLARSAMLLVLRNKNSFFLNRCLRRSRIRQITALNSAPFATTGDGNAPFELASDFGAPDGTPVVNRDSILSDVDRAVSPGLGKGGRPPDLEVLLADHLTYTGHPLMQSLHLSILRFGHVAVRYTKQVRLFAGG